MQWRTQLDAAQIQAVTAMIDAAKAVDGVAPVSEQAEHSLTETGPARHLVVDGGYANLTPARGEHPAMAEVVVDPAARGRGLGAALVGTALAEGGVGARVWAHGDLPAARAVAARSALRPARTLLQMRRPLDSTVPEWNIPAGVVLRSYAGPADDTELLRVNNAAFDWHPEQGGWSSAEIAVRRAEEWFDPDGLFLLTDEAGRLLGFHWTKVHSDTVGEVYIVAVDPAAHGRGFGRLLTVAGLRYLRARGLETVLLYTEADNGAAVATYRKLDFVTFHTDVAYAASATCENRVMTG